MSQFKAGQKLRGKISRTKYILGTFDIPQNAWNISLFEGKHVGMISEVTLTEGYEPLEEPAVMTSKYAIGVVVESIANGKRYTLVKPGNQPGLWTVNRLGTNVTLVMDEKVMDLKCIIVEDEKPQASPVSKYASGQRYETASGTVYILGDFVKEQGKWETHRVDSAYRDLYVTEDYMNVNFTPVASPVAVTKAEPKAEPVIVKHCCRIGFAQHLANRLCPSHDSKPKIDLSFMADTWDCLPNADRRKP